MMSKRFVWNFEIKNESLLELPSNNDMPVDELRWESRYFWPESAIISLNGLDDQFLELSRYEAKHRQDTYYLLPDVNFNLKMRRDQLLYKPMLKQMTWATAYGKKIKLTATEQSLSIPDHNPIDIQSLLVNAKDTIKTVTVSKEALIYQFPTTPKLKMELARLCIGDAVYFSLSLESKVLTWVEYLSKNLLQGKTPCDYVTFLKTLI
ncbi:hypothetical protein [Legionella oakridgensis]|nr:hypothetical protein [Legionella oakridgensis]